MESLPTKIIVFTRFKTSLKFYLSDIKLFTTQTNLLLIYINIYMLTFKERGRTEWMWVLGILERKRCEVNEEVSWRCNFLSINKLKGGELKLERETMIHTRNQLNIPFISFSLWHLETMPFCHICCGILKDASIHQTNSYYSIQLTNN